MSARKTDSSDRWQRLVSRRIANMAHKIGCIVPVRDFARKSNGVASNFAECRGCIPSQNAIVAREGMYTRLHNARVSKGFGNLLCVLRNLSNELPTENV